MNKEEKIAHVEEKFSNLFEIFYSSIPNIRTENEQLLYESIYETGIKNVDTIKSIILYLINKVPDFQFNKDNYQNMILEKEHINNIMDYIWTIEDKPEIIPPNEYYEKIKSGLHMVQLETINNIIENKFQNGIISLATGCGKSFIILNCIQNFYEMQLTDNRSILVFTERKNILLDLFFTKLNGKYVEKTDYYDIWKKVGFIDMENFNIINLVSDKNNDWSLPSFLPKNNKTNLILINRVYLTLYEKYKKISLETSPQLIIYDECQGISAKTSFNFLKYAIEVWNSKILGFSATPYRSSGKARRIMKKNNLHEIFSLFENDNLLNIYQNYNILCAINDGICCKLDFVWYKLIKTKGINMKSDRYLPVTKDDVKNCMSILNDNIHKLYYKKIICWCSTIKNADRYKEYFIEILNNETHEYENLKGLSIYVDHSLNSEDYEDFYQSNGNSILFCVGKHREGSDIAKLDCGVFLDKVDNRGDVVWLQSIGRISRNSPNKDFGLIIDTYYEKETTDDYEVIIDKLIGYYILLETMMINNNNINKKELYEKAKKDIHLDETRRKLIHINNLNVYCENINWDDFSVHFEHLFNNKLQKKINIEGKERLEIICDILKTHYSWTHNTDFWNEYLTIDKTEYELPEDIYTEFKSIFNKKTWYELLGYDNMFFKKMEDFQDFFRKNNVKILNEEIYDKWCKIERKLPKSPDEYFRNNSKYISFKSLIIEKNNKVIV